MSEHFERARVRAAPSPTGPPHVGTAYIALFDYVHARRHGGDFVLRIEDTDRKRSTRESEEAIVESLKWLGLQWDEGPDCGGPYGPYRQSERGDVYSRYADQLLERDHAYRCFCTPERLDSMRKRQRKEGAAVGYDRRCRGLTQEEAAANLEQGIPFTVRLKVPLKGTTRFRDRLRGDITVQNTELQDQILLKSDGLPTYHLANVVDDHLMKISHVIRAEEWISSTPLHVLLYSAFGWEMPEFIHMPLLRNKDKTKISKRKNPTSLLWYREQGFLPEAMLNFLALLGWSIGEQREVFVLPEMIEEFSWDDVKTTGPVFDLEKLEWLNGEHIRRMPAEALLQRILRQPYTRHVDQPVEKMLEITRLIQERIERLSEFDEQTNFFFEREEYDPEELVPRKQAPAFLGRALDGLLEEMAACEGWSAEPLENILQTLAERMECKRGPLYMIVRVAVTCRRVSTPLFETMEILGRQECLERLRIAREKARGLAGSP